MKRMKSGEVVGPSDIPVQVWRSPGERTVDFLTRLFNTMMETKRMPEEWRRGVLVPIFNKRNLQTCSNYRAIRLMSHTIKLLEREVQT